jgi:hypothetical protein
MTKSDEETKPVGMKVNIGKCAVMFNDFCDEESIEIEGQTVEKLDKFVYLGDQHQRRLQR